MENTELRTEKTTDISSLVPVIVGGFGDFHWAQLTVVPTVSHLTSHVRLLNSFPFSYSRPFLVGHSFRPLSLLPSKLPNSSKAVSHFMRTSFLTKPVSYLFPMSF